MAIVSTYDLIACLYLQTLLHVCTTNSTTFADSARLLRQRTVLGKTGERSEPNKSSLKPPTRKHDVRNSQRIAITAGDNHSKIAGRRRLLRPITNCCENGGQCVLGSFCVCPREYFGRYCEFELGRLDCGEVPHLSWLRQDCSICYCYDGHLSCLPRAPELCTNPTEKPQKGISSEREIFEVKSDISDDFPHLPTEDYEYDGASEMDAKSSAGIKRCLSVIVMTLARWGSSTTL